ncbi:MAG: BofC C-terminal domain-containing protein [Acidobacteriota bacterium]
MSKKVKTALIIIVVSFIVGIMAAHYRIDIKNLWQPVFNPSLFANQQVTPSTQIIMEKAYTRCRHLTIEKSENPTLVGQDLSGVKEIFPVSKSCLVLFNEQHDLVIHQRIDDWCPADRSSVHLGISDGCVCIIRGPTGINDEIVRMTAIKAATLPQQMQHNLESGLLEFGSEDQAYFVLENMDEYE